MDNPFCKSLEDYSVVLQPSLELLKVSATMLEMSKMTVVGAVTKLSVNNVRNMYHVHFVVKVESEGLLIHYI